MNEIQKSVLRRMIIEGIRGFSVVEQLFIYTTIASSAALSARYIFEMFSIGPYPKEVVWLITVPLAACVGYGINLGSFDSMVKLYNIYGPSDKLIKTRFMVRKSYELTDKRVLFLIISGIIGTTVLLFNAATGNSGKSTRSLVEFEYYSVQLDSLQSRFDREKASSDSTIAFYTRRNLIRYGAIPERERFSKYANLFYKRQDELTIQMNAAADKFDLAQSTSLITIFGENSRTRVFLICLVFGGFFFSMGMVDLLQKVFVSIAFRRRFARLESQALKLASQIPARNIIYNNNYTDATPAATESLQENCNGFATQRNAEKSDIATEIDAVVATLPPNERQLYDLITLWKGQFRDINKQAIADELSCNRSTVWRRIVRLNQKGLCLGVINETDNEETT